MRSTGHERKTYRQGREREGERVGERKKERCVYIVTVSERKEVRVFVREKRANGSTRERENQERNQE